MEYSPAYKAKLLQYLYECILEQRKQKIEQISMNRTRHITIALENLYQSHNASAVIRTAECLGIQDIHIIENEYAYNVNTEISMSADQWLTLYHYNNSENNTLDCIKQLKQKGYTVVATTPHENDCFIQDLDISTPTAFLFGTELTGLSQTALKNADKFVKIPLYGFIESYNISVAAAITLMDATTRMRQNSSINWQLTPEELLDLKINWATNSIKNGNLVTERFHQMQKQTKIITT